MRSGRVLITGSGGMLGSAIHPYFQQHFDVRATDKIVKAPWLEQLDVRDEVKLRRVFDDFQPDLVLHLAAETDLEFCEANPEIAAEVNAYATSRVAELAEKRGCTLVYISTAGVFDGHKETFYTEEDIPRPIMVYGQTKLDGENYVRSICRKHYVVRAGWMVGGGFHTDHKFVFRIIEQLTEGRKVIHAVDDRLGTPTYTEDFARTLFALLGHEAYGTYHMVCAGSGSRYDVAREVVRICGLTDVEVKPVDSEFFREQFPAPRPRSEMMRNANLEKLGINLMRHWTIALRDYLEREYLNPKLSAAVALQARTRVHGPGIPDGAHPGNTIGSGSLVRNVRLETGE